MPIIILPDGSKKVFKKSVTILEIAQSIGAGLAKATIAGKVNDVLLDATIPINKDKKIDLLLNFLDKQSFIPRLTFLIYTNANYSYKDSYSQKYRCFYLKKSLENKYKIERVIFQAQENNKLGIVLHTKNIEFINSYINSKDENFFRSSNRYTKKNLR